MKKSTTLKARPDWDAYIHEHGLEDLGRGTQSQTFRSGEVVVKVPRRKLVRSLLGEEKLWRRIHKESVGRLGDLALPFEYIEKPLTCIFRRKLMGIIPYKEEEVHPAYVVQEYTPHETTLLHRMSGGVELISQGLSDLIALSKACLTRGTYLHDMAFDNFVYWKGRLRIRDIGAMATDVAHVRRLIALKGKLFDPNLAFIRTSSVDGVSDFCAHLSSYLSAGSVDMMQKHLNKGKPVPKVTLY